MMRETCRTIIITKETNWGLCSYTFKPLDHQDIPMMII